MADFTQTDDYSASAPALPARSETPGHRRMEVSYVIDADETPSAYTASLRVWGSLAYVDLNPRFD